jgi:hypothetical protein
MLFTSAQQKSSGLSVNNDLRAERKQSFAWETSKEVDESNTDDTNMQMADAPLSIEDAFTSDMILGTITCMYPGFDN